MMHRRAVLGGSLALAAVGAASPSAGQTVIRPALFSETIFYLPVWIAMEKGFFADAGVAFDFEPGVSMKQASDALMDGSSPIAMMGPEIVFAHGGDERARIIAGSTNRLPHFLIAQPKFRKVTDLRGATFGVISDVEGTTFVVQRIAAAAGLKRSEYTITAVGGAPARVKLLESGEIDAALQPFPLSYEAEAKGFSNLGWSGEVVPDWQFGVVVANRAWLRSNQDATANMLHAILRGRRYMTDHPDEAGEIAARRIKAKPALARRAVGDILRLGIMDARLRWSEAGLREVYTTLQQVDVVPRTTPFDVSRYVDPRPLDRALARYDGARPSRRSPA